MSSLFLKHVTTRSNNHQSQEKIRIMDKDISVTLKVWRQRGPKEKGQFETYKIEKINQSVSFLEMLDILNEQLVNEGKEPIVFDHDCARVSVACVHCM